MAPLALLKNLGFPEINVLMAAMAQLSQHWLTMVIIAMVTTGSPMDTDWTLTICWTQQAECFMLSIPSKLLQTCAVDTTVTHSSDVQSEVEEVIRGSQVIRRDSGANLYLFVQFQGTQQMSGFPTLLHPLDRS